jgi:ubiquinone/menaquinone biosynthesis C-methylase UbiE
MNLMHRWLCRSGYWRKTIAERLPEALYGVDLGENVLAVGPGPGVTRDVLVRRVRKLTCLEIDAKLAASLRQRTQREIVRVLEGDATAMTFPDATFSGAVCFTMLHHVPSSNLQDRLLGKVLRVLKPGATFAGTDSRWGVAFGVLHWWDTMVMVDPATFDQRLERAGFKDVSIRVEDRSFFFRARRA